MKLTGKGQVTIPRMVLVDVLTNAPDWCDGSENKLLETVETDHLAIKSHLFSKYSNPGTHSLKA